MRLQLHGYQEAAVAFLRERRQAALLLDMGLGKTAIALTAITDLLLSGEDLGKVLVIAPLMPAKHTWPDEIAKWDHTEGLRVSLVMGSAKERERAVMKGADIYIVNRENVVWLVEVFGRRWPFKTVIIDELSSFKNSRSKRFKALRRVRAQIGRIWGLTGTPAPNGLMDLWAQVNLIDCGERLGRRIGQYRERYFLPGSRSGYVVYNWVLRPRAEEAIYAKLSDIALSMRAADKLDLPGRVDNTVYAYLTPGQMREYRAFERDQVADIGDAEITAASAASLANKLLQWANGAIYADDPDGGYAEVHDAKLEALGRILESAQGEPVLVFYAYRHDKERILKAYPDAKVLDAASDDLVERWNEGGAPVLLAHPQQAGHGLNLQRGGHIIVWFGLTWNLESYMQANARLDRQGQTKCVSVHHIVAKDTVDERVMGVLAGKQSLQDAMMDTLKDERDGGSARR